MSQAYLMVGIKLTEVLKKVTEKKPVTKYNEDTGQPYEKEVEETYWTLFGKSINTLEDPEDYPNECGIEKLGFVVHYPYGFRNNLNDAYFGLDVVELDKDGEQVKVFTHDDTQEAFDKLHALLIKHGYRQGNGNACMALIMILRDY